MQDKFSFENGIKELEELILQLEKGDLPLEDAAGLYGKATVIASLCRKELDNARLKITEISSGENEGVAE